MPWAIVEAEDEASNGDWLTHILPVVEHTGSDSREEEEAFLERLVSAGCPCLTDDDDCVTSTYFGHTLSASCPCGPKARESDPGCYIHNQVN